MNTLYSVQQVADHFGLSAEQVVRRCSSAVAPWPHLRPISRKSSTWRFSAEDIEAIEQRISSRVISMDSWGRTGNRRSA